MILFLSLCLKHYALYIATYDAKTVTKLPLSWHALFVKYYSFFFALKCILCKYRFYRCELLCPLKHTLRNISKLRTKWDKNYSIIESQEIFKDFV